MKKALISLFIILLLAISPAWAVQKTITLAWDHDGVDLAGFKIYYGPSAGNYTTNVDVGMASSCSAPDTEQYCHTMTLDVPENAITSYYFTATAYDAENNESEYAVDPVVTFDFEVPPAVSDLAATYDKDTQTLTFTWSYETAWLPKIEKWSLFIGDADAGPWSKVVDIPYDPNASPPYTTDVSIPIPEGEKVIKYYTLVAFRPSENNSTFSSNSNVVEVTVDRMPPKAPFEFKIKIR